MPEISIIVPVYNVAQYLHKCVDSILAQTFSDFEVILVDDGATDDSGAICDEYARKEPRVRVIHKPNGGLSDARNAGIEAAKAPYLGFIDSDDYISREMFQLLHDDITKENADLAICGIYDVYGDKTPREKPHTYEVLNREAAIVKIFEGNIISVHAVNKLYRREIFDQVRYPKGKYHEDSYVILDVLGQCDKIVADTKQVYYYTHREGSINTEHFSAKQFDFIDAWEKNEKKLAEASPKVRHVARQRVCFANFLVLDKLLNGNARQDYPTECKQMVKYLRHNAGFIFKDEIFTKSRKIAMVALLFSVSLYSQVIRLHQQ